LLIIKPNIFSHVSPYFSTLNIKERVYTKQKTVKNTH